MILYNPSLADVETDNHWLPAVHLADGTQFLAFMAGHTGVTATFTAGQKTSGKGDVMAAFSSRGPGGLGIKPDITAPGVQILAGNTPTPAAIEAGPRHLHVGAAHHRLRRAAEVTASGLDPGADQVRPDDHGEDRRGQGGRDHPGRSVRLR
jgi:hypothetical protein